MKIRIIILILILFYANEIIGQISQGGFPYSFKSNLKSANSQLVTDENIPFIVMPKISEGEIQEIKDKNNIGSEAFQFAKAFDIELNVKSLSKIDTLENGLLYRLIIISDRAYSINLIFNNYKIPPGAELFMYSSDKAKVIGAFTSNNNKLSRKFSTQPISGDKIVIEYFEPLYSLFLGELIINRVSHDFTGTFEMNAEAGSGGCQVDVNCEEGANWQNEKRAVCKIIFDGTAYCTGALLNNTNLDGLPYFLTANHCICSQSFAESSVVIFNYERPVCKSGTGSTAQSIDGADLVSTNANSDFTLLRLSSAPIPDFNPYFAGWDRSNSQNAGGVGIHHPKGDVKKIATYNIVPNNAIYMNFTYDEGCGEAFYPNESYWGMRWKQTPNGYSVPESGSSGSPLFNSEHNIIGQLFGGGRHESPFCLIPALNISNYGKIYSSWEAGNNNNSRLREWLDPIGSQVQFLNGANICPDGVVQYLNLSYDINSGITKSYKANYIEAKNNIKAGGMASYIAGKKIKLEPGFHSEPASIFSAKVLNFNCVPGHYPINVEVWTTYVIKGNDLCYNISNATYFDVYVYTLNGTLVNHSSGNFNSDHICVWNTLNNTPGYYLITALFKNDWTEVSKSYTILVGSSTKSAKLETEEKPLELNTFTKYSDYQQISPFDFSISPNPNNGDFIIKTKIVEENNFYSLEIINCFGQIVFCKYNIIENNIEVNKSELPKGIYLVRILNNLKQCAKKIIVE